MKKLIVLAPYPDRTGLDLICHVDDATLSRPGRRFWPFWKRNFPGKAKVAVVQDGTMQYMKPA